MIPSVWRVAEPTPVPARPALDGILEPGVDALPVRITIYQDNVLTGWDDGALGFEADGVWFSGGATSFRLSPADLLPARPPVLLTFRSDLPELRLRHPYRQVAVCVAPLEREGADVAEDQAWVREEVARLRGVPAAFESQYPPLAPRPGMVNPLPVRLTPPRRAGLAGACLLVGYLAHDAFAFVVFAALALFAATWGLADADQRALRRIAREEAG